MVMQVDPRYPHLADLSALLQSTSLRIEQDLGIRVPGIEMATNSPDGRWTMLVDEVPLAGGPLKDGRQRIALAVDKALRRTASKFMGVQETQDLLDRLEKIQPALVREVVPRLVPPVLLAEILARLVEEQVPIRNLRSILATLAEWARTEADPAALAERVRHAQGALISHQVAPQGTMKTLLLDPAVEHLIESALKRTSGGTLMALAPEESEAVLRGLEQAMGDAGEASTVVLVRPDLRRPFWKLISATHSWVRVLSFLELDPALSVQPTGMIRLNTQAQRASS